MEEITLNRATFDALLTLAQRAPKFTASERYAVADAEDAVRRAEIADHPQDAGGYYQPALFDPTPYEA